jgi:hypothetical protein
MSRTPQLILNADETGFGASQLGRAKSRKVIVPTGFSPTPVLKEYVDSHCAIALRAISVERDILTPGLVTKRETDNLDTGEYSSVPSARRYTNPKAIVTRQNFADYLRTIISLYIAKWWKLISDDVPAMILFDGHKTHLGEPLNPCVAESGIILSILPSHSSH